MHARGTSMPLLLLCTFLMAFAVGSWAQDSSTGAIRGTVIDASGALLPFAKITVTSNDTGAVHRTATDVTGSFAVQLLPPGEYSVRAEANGMAATVRSEVVIEVGGEVQLELRLSVAAAKQTLNVSGDTPIVETQPSTTSSVISENEINNLPLNGRRFTDLALLTPGVTQDPRGLTSSSNGDLAFGGIRGFQTSFLVDGSDNNNGFFGQARGRYRAPYQFSNEVVQEFRVSSNTYGAELGRSGGAVINVVTKSGSNRIHGSAFYYGRDNKFNAQPAYTTVKPKDRQQQFGFTVGGPLKKDKIFIFSGYDQHIFRVPTVVHFLNGSTSLKPSASDYEERDKQQVFAAAQQLSTMGGEYGSSLLGNAAFTKVDWNISPREYASLRLSTSRYYGTNNVYFDPASPITTNAISFNGQERVATQSVSASLTSALSYRSTSHLRLQFSNDSQESTPNSYGVRTRIYDVIDSFGRSSIMPRQTREHRLHLADTVTREGRRNSWKFGGDLMLTYTRNFFPMMFGGEYIFSDVNVNQWTFAPSTYGMSLTPLRAYAHGVPRYYVQDFGQAVSHPDSNEYAGFVQDTLRATNHLGLTLGVRYDLQTFRGTGLISNPLWPESGKVPRDTNNFSPRLGFAYSIGDRRPFVIRGGYGMFYTRIPQMYTSQIATENGVDNEHVYLNVSDYWGRQVFPTYPNPLVDCPVTAGKCEAPENLAGLATADVSSFSRNFRIPRVHQASLGIEREVAKRTAVGVNYLFVHGEHLIRALGANLPPPTNVEYPVYDETGTKFLNQYYTVQSFAGWQMTRTVDCPFTPCVAQLQRPIPQLGTVTVFDSEALSYYNAMTVSARRRMTNGLYFRLAYTWAHAIDDGQDALVIGRPVTVQNAYSAKSERGSSTTDQRQRLALSWMVEPRPFHREHEILKRIFNGWRSSGVLTIGSGRPVNPRVVGDANADGNTDNDRLPGAARNSYTGPDYATLDLRLARTVKTFGKVRIESTLESFNALNRDNKRLLTTDDGFQNTAASFVQQTSTAGGKVYPAQFRVSGGFLTPTSAYSPRQIQVSVKVSF
jgi:Carboxypeptidase regulatory-like domain/TonB dependent receptor-like, beta-barrel